MSEFKPEEYGPLLDRLAQASGTHLELVRADGSRDTDNRQFPVRLANQRTDWAVAARGDDASDQRTAQVAAEVVSHLYTAAQDISSLSTEVADRYEELNFLYDMGDRVGALLDEDEICAFVAKEAAWLLDCERTSVMVVEPESGQLKIRAAIGLPEEISEEVTVRPGERISGKVFETGRPMLVNEGDPMPAESLGVDELRESNCFLSVPLKVSADAAGEEVVLGVINLTRKRRGGAFTASDQKLVSTVASTTATQIHNCRLINAERERQRLEQELELAARIQLSLLPDDPLAAGDLRAAGVCRAARHVGGDLFDYWMQDDHVCMVVADVSGHDIGAALMAAALRSVVRSEAGHRRSVAGLMSRVNRALYEDLVRSELFISAFYAEVELASGMVTFCRAGHPKPLLLQDEEHWLDTEGMLLGLQEDGLYEQQVVELDPDAALVLYTDGLMEAIDESGNTFGVDGVREAAISAMARPPKQMAAGIVDAAQHYSNQTPPADDMTVLVVRYGDGRDG
ncbi:MAG: GAF domain-containing SpoIIE family protein phosphatase [Candidatus Brocadiia bacterium]